MMNLERLFALIALIVRAISFIVVYKKICNVKKIKIIFIFIFLGIVFINLLPVQVYLFLPSYGYILNHAFHYLLLFLQPIILYIFFYKKRLYDKFLCMFLAFFIYLSILSSETFFSVIISSVTGNNFVDQYWGSYYVVINSLSLFITLKYIDFFEFQFNYFKRIYFIREINSITKSYIIIHILLNISHILSEDAHLNSFASMIATICFILFLSSLFYLKSVRERYEKIKEIKQKEKEQRQLQLYTDEIVQLYNEIRGFRHDYASMLISLQIGINTGDMKEVENIFHNVLKKANLSLRSDDYTFFELNNVKDTALRSVMIQTIFKAREHEIEILFEVKDEIERLPMNLLDLVRVASVLLNNAVEGAAESTSKSINISLVNLENEIIFVIQNSRQSRHMNIEEIYEMGFSTKGKNRGLGLSNVKEIISKYEDIILETDITSNSFTQVLIFKRKEIL